MKGLVLFGLLWRRRDEIDGPTDGVIYAAMVGLGFAMVENVGYYINAIVTPERGGIALLGYTFVLRGVLSPLLHPIFTSMTGLGVAYAASRPRGSAQRQVGGVPRLAGRGGAARHLERAVPVRRGGPDRRVPDHVVPCSAGLILVLVPGPPPHGRPDPALPARLRLHRPADRRRRGHAGLAAGPRRRPHLGAHGGRAARHRRDGRLPARRDRARAGPRQVRARRALPAAVRRPASGTCSTSCGSPGTGSPAASRPTPTRPPRGRPPARPSSPATPRPPRR